MSNITLSIDELESLLKEQIYLVSRSIDNIGGHESFQKVRRLNIVGLETELRDDIKSAIENTKLPNDFTILKKYLK